MEVAPLRRVTTCIDGSGLERRLQSRVPREKGHGVPEGRTNLKPSEEDFWHKAGVYDYSEASSARSTSEVATREPACGEQHSGVWRCCISSFLNQRFHVCLHVPVLTSTLHEISALKTLSSLATISCALPSTLLN